MESSLNKQELMPSLFCCFLLFSACFFLFSCGDLDNTVTSIVISPLSPTIGINKTQSFSAIAKNSLGQIVSTTATWTSTGAGSITSTGFYTAGSSSGEAKVYATTGGVTASVTAIITEKAWIQGTVFDSVGHKVPDLKVYIKQNTSLFNSTDSSGFYSISNVPAGTYEVWTIETSAYRPCSNEVTVGSGETKTKNFVILYFSDPVDLNPPEFTP